MKRAVLGGLAFTFLSCTVNTAQAQRRANRDGDDAAAHGWESNYDAGLETARRTDRPLMVVFRCVP